MKKQTLQKILERLDDEINRKKLKLVELQREVRDRQAEIDEVINSLNEK